MREVAIRIFGTPQPKGSAKAFVPLSWAKAAVVAGRQPRAVITNDNPRAKGWEQLVREQAQRATDGQLFDGAIAVAMTFYLPRPVSLPARVQQHMKRPDVDKLARAVLDGLTGILFADDARVVSLIARKVYAVSAPGAFIEVREAELPCELALFAEAQR